MLKQVQAQIQALAKKQPRTAQETEHFKKLVLEQNKILASGKLVPTIPGQHAQGLQFVSGSPFLSNYISFFSVVNYYIILTSS